MINIVEFYAFSFQLFVNLIIGFSGNLGHFFAAISELFSNDLLIFRRQAVEYFGGDIYTAGAQEVLGGCYVFNVLVAFGADVGELGAFQTIYNALRNAGQGFGERQAGSSCAHSIDSINEQLAARSTQLQAFHVFRFGNNFVGHNITETKDVVQSQNLDAFVFSFFHHVFYERSFNHLLVFVIGLVQHRTNQRLEVRYIVAQVRRILYRNEVSAISNLLQTILVASQLVLTIALNFYTTIGFLVDAFSNKLHGFVKLFIRREYVAQLQNYFFVIACRSSLFVIAAAASQSQHHYGHHKHSNYLFHCHPPNFLLKFVEILVENYSHY